MVLIYTNTNCRCWSVAVGTYGVLTAVRVREFSVNIQALQFGDGNGVSSEAFSDPHPISHLVAVHPLTRLASLQYPEHTVY